MASAKVELEFACGQAAVLRKNRHANANRRNTAELFRARFGGRFVVQAHEAFGPAVPLRRLILPSNELPEIPGVNIEIDVLDQGRLRRYIFNNAAANKIL